MGHGLVWNHSPVLAHIPAFPCHFRGEGTVSLRAHGLGHASLCSDSGLELLHLSTGLRIKLISSDYSSVLGNLTWLSLALTDCQKSSCRCWKVVLFWPLTGNRAETQEFEFMSGEIRDRTSVSSVTKLQFIHSISHSAAVRVSVFASFTHFRVRSHNFSLWHLQMILTYVHKRLESVNQCPVTSCRKAINRQQEEKVLPPIQGKGELALIF